MKNSKNILMIESFKVPEKKGTYHRLLCLSGLKKGVSYFIKSDRVLMGRSEDSDIQIFDDQASREHAEIRKVGDDFFLTDLNSQNGIFVNEIKTKQVQLKENDLVVIGKSVFKFTRVEVAEKEFAIDKAQREKEEELQQEEEKKKESSTRENKQKKMILYVLVGLLTLWVVLDDEESSRIDSESKSSQKKNLLILFREKKIKLIKKFIIN